MCPRGRTCSALFGALQLHPADGATVAVISQLSTMCLFSQWILIFSIFSYTVFLVGVLRLIQ